MTAVQQLEIDPALPVPQATPGSAAHRTHRNSIDRYREKPQARRIPNAAVDRNSAPEPAVRTVRVALAGCGVVGGGFVRLLQESAATIAARFGVRFDFTRVLVRDVGRERNLPLDSALFTNDLGLFLAHDADVVIEAVGGDEPARTIACAALARGKKLITANKEVIASHGDGLVALALANNTGLDFGAAVGGSAPVISTLRDLTGGTAPNSVRGILNGTSNYVITLLERGFRLDAALASARERGLAEADCARDLDGRDAADKLAIVAWVTFGIRPADLIVRRTSLLPGFETLVRFAAIRGGCLRLIAECTQLPGHRVAATVEPVIVPLASAFARTTFEENRVEVDLGWSSPLCVSGPGAGGPPTASALLSDLLRVAPTPIGGGAGAGHFTSVPDPREHRWLVAAEIDAASLECAATAGGIRAEYVTASGSDTAIISEPSSWDSIRGLLAALNASNAAPSVARYELAPEAEGAQ